eukprot:scaffold10856_cov229-Amphora_coffeaeformis.AAC.27
MAPSSSTLETTKTNRWGTLSVSSENDEKKNPRIIPPLIRPAHTPIVIGSDLALSKDPSTYSQQDPVMLKQRAQELPVPPSYGKGAKVSTAAATALLKLDASPTTTSPPMSDPTVTSNTTKTQFNEKKTNIGKLAKKATIEACPQPVASSPKCVDTFHPDKDSFATDKSTVLSANITAELKRIPHKTCSKVIAPNSVSEDTILPLSSAMDGTSTTDQVGFLLRQSTFYPSYHVLVQAEMLMESKSIARKSRVIETEEPTKGNNEIVTETSGLGDKSRFTKPSSTSDDKLRVFVNQETVRPSTLAKKLIVLIARQCFDRTSVQNQQNAMTILDLKGIQYQTIDGADPVNKTERNSLFSLSGFRGKYPQFFFVYGSEKVFWGDFQKFTEANDDGILEQELRDGGKVPRLKSKYNDTSVAVVAAPTTIIPNGDTCATGTTTNASVLVLLSRQSFDRDVRQHQQIALTILDSKRIKYKTFDGADSANKEQRNALFALSGLRAKYPQFFLVRGGQTTFYGGMNTLIKANDAGSLANDLGMEPAESMVSTTLAFDEILRSRRFTDGKQPSIDESKRILGEEIDVAPTHTTKDIAEPLKAESATEIASTQGERDTENASGNKLRYLDISAAMAADNSNAPATDITIYGATSFVVKHIITYMVSFLTMGHHSHGYCRQNTVSHTTQKVQTSIHLDEPVTITLAGRNEAKIESLKKEWEEEMALLAASSREDWGRCNFDVYIADSADVDRIRRMAARTRVVLSCVGNYRQYGNTVVAACAELGTDYVDTATEIGWVGEMRGKYGSAAAASGSRVISLCGLESVFSDLAVFAAVEALKKECGNSTQIEKGFTWHVNAGGKTGANLKKIHNCPSKLGFCFVRSVPFLLDDPLVLAHPKVRGDPKSLNLRNKLAVAEWLNQMPMFHTFLEGGGISLPFVMATVNAKFVHASALSLKYGPNFTYLERYLAVGVRCTTQLRILSFIPALLAHIGILLGLLVLRMPLLGSLLLTCLGGPVSEGMCASGHAEVSAK